jgi:hypothetical protein
MTAVLKAAQTNNRRVAFIEGFLSRLERLDLFLGQQVATSLRVVSRVNKG